jgi:hypothetical protein
MGGWVGWWVGVYAFWAASRSRHSLVRCVCEYSIWLYIRTYILMYVFCINECIYVSM